MFEIVLEDNTIFKEAFKSISKIVDDIQIQVDSDGLRLKALDRSHITFVSLNLKPDVFDEFTCDGSESINLDSNELMNILKRCKASDVLHLSNDESNFIIKFENDVVKTFKIRLSDLEYSSPDVPTLEFSSEIMIESDLLKDAIGDMELFSDKLFFNIGKDYFIVGTDGDFGDSNFKYLHGVNVSEEVTAQFAINKLKDIFSASRFSDIVTIQLSNNAPVNIAFENGDGSLEFLLAPRLESE